MNEPKNKEQTRSLKGRAMASAAAEPDGSALPDNLSTEWQQEFLLNARLERARIPVRFAGKTLENFAINRNPKRKEVIQNAENYIRGFQSNTVDGLLLTGCVGCGKTHIAVAILQAVIRKGYTGLYYNMPDLLSDIRSTYDTHSELSEGDLLEEVNEPDLLLLDDLGAETAKDWVNDRLYLLINRRYEMSKPILVTTNLDLEELTQKLGSRTVSRLCEMCHRFAEFPKEDFRRQNMR